jgi:cytochrome c oxidase subunit 2
MSAGGQSTFQPAAGSGAALIHELALVLYFGAALLFLLVSVLVLRAVFRPGRPVSSRRWLIGGGLILPAVVLLPLLFYGLAVGNALTSVNGEGALRFLLDCISGSARSLGVQVTPGRPVRVEVVAKQWWWEVSYITGDAEPVVLANELRLPVGRPVEVMLTTADVIHSFWVPSLAGKVDMIPGHRNRLVLRANQPGLHRGQCAEFCGGQHALMAFHVEMLPEPEFDRWLTHQASAARTPVDPFLAQGREVFMNNGCGGCHAVRGTAARGVLGPDLTHVGGRHSLAAGTLDNHVGTMAGWVVATQTLKPGAAMPSTRVGTGEELRALAAWLESLE